MSIECTGHSQNWNFQNISAQIVQHELKVQCEVAAL